MQAAKDTFLKTLAGRLAVLNPNRTVTVDGASRPGVLAVENENATPGNKVLHPGNSTAGLPGDWLEVFLLNWDDASYVMPEGRLMQVDCTAIYGSKGTDGMMGTDRGRIVNAMDLELRRISEPRQTTKADHTQNPPAALGSNIFWTQPVFANPSGANGVLMRAAKIRVFFFPEVG
jgi:hypothetical protein